ncbi:MAG: TRAP transporter large permease [Lachnospiraceae bacterium]|nr:TRAP transporter large permease [Lachnospiraceae bacterium]
MSLNVVMIGLFIFLLIIGVPIVFCAAGTAMYCFVQFDLTSLSNVSFRMYGALTNFTLVALPLFIILGVIMSQGNLVQYIFGFANSIVRNITGGMGVAAIITSAVFAAISGASLANAAALGMILMPVMVKYGYKEDFTAGILAVGGTLGILIPPSVTMIMFGTLTEQSVGQLFMSGMIPGIIAAIILSVFTVFLAHIKRDKSVKTEKIPISGKEVWTEFKKAFPILLAPVLILGGIYGGFFTPDESAAVASVYCLLIAMFVYKTIKPKEVFKVFKTAAVGAAQIMIIYAGVNVLGFVITMSRLSNDVLNAVVGAGIGKWGFMAIVNVILIIMGCFLDVTSVMLITIPIVYPIFVSFGIHPLHLAVIYTLNMEIGTITPPVGMNLFALSSSAKIPVSTVVRGVLPYIFVMILILLIVIFFPILSTWLPSMMY